MSSDETLRQYDAILRTSELQKLIDGSYESFDSAKTGNGWSVDLLEQENKLAFKPISADSAERAAEEHRPVRAPAAGGPYGRRFRSQGKY